MSRAAQIVAELLETEDDPDAVYSKRQVLDVKNWHDIDLIHRSDWRGFFKQLGWRIANFRRSKSDAGRRYALLFIILSPIDGHPVDAYDARLLKDYAYEFLEQKYKKKRSEIDLNVEADAYGTGEGAYMPRERDLPYGANYIDIHIREPDSQDRIQWKYLDY